jgi:hypothetical protein
MMMRGEGEGEGMGEGGEDEEGIHAAMVAILAQYHNALKDKPREVGYSTFYQTWCRPHVTVDQPNPFLSHVPSDSTRSVR